MKALGMWTNLRTFVAVVVLAGLGLLAPGKAQAVGGLTSKTISAGGLNSLVVKSDGTAWGWGKDQFGEIGDWVSFWNGYIPAPYPMLASPSLSNIVAVAEGGWDMQTGHALYLRGDGVVLSEGANGYGQLGDGTSHDRMQPVIA